MKPWTDLLDRPTFVLTSDQDWAPDWTCEVLLAEARSAAAPLHVFRTNPCAPLDAAVRAGEITQGWHPNFLEGSSHGRTVADVVDYCRRHFPGARTARSHSFAEDSARSMALAEAGIVAESQPCTPAQAYIAPLVHWTGPLRLPVYFEDDVFFELVPDALPLDALAPSLFTPGLKILNFHATFVGCNTPSRAHYEARKSAIFASQGPVGDLVFSGRGSLTVFRELTERIRKAGYAFESFESVVSRFLERAGDVVPPALRRRRSP